MVTEAVAELKGEPVREPAEVKLDLPARRQPARRTTCAKEELRLEAYRRLAAVTTDGRGRRHPRRVGGPLRPGARAGRGAARRRPPAGRVPCALGVTRGQRHARARASAARLTARISPLQLATSQQIRLERLSKGAVYKEDLGQLVSSRSARRTTLAARPGRPCLLGELVPAEAGVGLSLREPMRRLLCPTTRAPLLVARRCLVARRGCGDGRRATPAATAGTAEITADVARSDELKRSSSRQQGLPATCSSSRDGVQLAGDGARARSTRPSSPRSSSLRVVLRAARAGRRRGRGTEVDRAPTSSRRPDDGAERQLELARRHDGCERASRRRTSAAPRPPGARSTSPRPSDGGTDADAEAACASHSLRHAPSAATEDDGPGHRRRPRRPARRAAPTSPTRRRRRAPRTRLDGAAAATSAAARQARYVAGVRRGRGRPAGRRGRRARCRPSSASTSSRSASAQPRRRAGRPPASEAARPGARRLPRRGHVREGAEVEVDPPLRPLGPRPRHGRPAGRRRARRRRPPPTAADAPARDRPGSSSSSASGPAGPTCVTAGTLAADRPGRRIRFLRTTRHPAASVVAGAPSFDDVYEAPSASTRSTAAIVDGAGRRRGRARRGALRRARLAAGAERTRRPAARRRRPGRGRGRCPALSFLDLAWVRLGVDPLERRRPRWSTATASPSRRRGAGPAARRPVRQPRGAVRHQAGRRRRPPTPVTVLQRLGPARRAGVRGGVGRPRPRRRARPPHLALRSPQLAAPVAGEVAALRRAGAHAARASARGTREQTHHTPHPPPARGDLRGARGASTALDDGDRADAATTHLEEELGDLLFQVVFHATLAAEAGAFTLADVARGIHDKLVHRHPHVFGDVDGRRRRRRGRQLGGRSRRPRRAAAA